jgi:hypothetical protein
MVRRREAPSQTMRRRQCARASFETPAARAPQEEAVRDREPNNLMVRRREAPSRTMRRRQCTRASFETPAARAPQDEAASVARIDRGSYGGIASVARMQQAYPAWSGGRARGAWPEAGRLSPYERLRLRPIYERLRLSPYERLRLRPIYERLRLSPYERLRLPRPAKGWIVRLRER